MHRIPLTIQDTHHTSQFSHFEIASFYISCIHPSLLWLRLCGHYYVSINQWAQLPGSGRITVCMRELHTIRGNNARQLVFPHQFPIWEIHAQVVNDLPTYYGLCCASVCADIRVVDQTYPCVSLVECNGCGMRTKEEGKKEI